MFRCVLAALALSFVSTAGAQTLPQQPYLKRDFPALTLRGQVTFLSPPGIELNGKAAQLSPGSRIRNQNNMVVLSGTLVGQSATVHYTVDDITHQVRDIWLLRRDELAKTPWPDNLTDAQAWRFDSAAQRWTKP